MVISLKHQQILEDRALDVELLATLGVETSGDSPSWLVIPYVQNGRVVNRKYRRFATEGRFRQDAGGRQCFWNFDCLLDRTLDHLPVIVTEGEFDAMAAIQAGFPRTLSVPGGAPPKPQGVDGDGTKYAFLDEALPLLRDAKRIILAVDGDEKGANLLQDLSHRLGRHRCQFLRYPKFLFESQRQKHDGRERCKDLNEVLETYGAGGVVEVVNAAEFIRVGGLYRMSELPPLPIVGAFDVGIAGLAPHFKIRLGDLSVITGIPSHGKTSFANEIACRMALPTPSSEEAASVKGLVPDQPQGTLLGAPLEDCGYGWTVAVASFEQRAQTDLRLNLRRFRGRCHPDALSKAALKAVDEWIDRHFVLIVPDEDEDASLPWFLERSAAAIVQYGARLVICDPWNELDHVRPPDMSLTEYTGFAIKQFRKQAGKYQAHQMVVAHPTKLPRSAKTESGEAKLPCPTLYDISDCHSADTEVLTERGWLPHALLTLADRVACFDPVTETLRHEQPSAIKRFDHDGPMAHFTGPSIDILVTPNHRMVLKPAWENPVGNPGRGRPERWRKGTWSFCHVREMPGSPLLAPLAAMLEGGDEPSTMPLDAGYRMEPFLRLLGWYLAEGWQASRSIAICQQPGALQESMRAVLAEDLALDIGEAVAAYPDRPHCAPTWRAYVRKRQSPELVDWFIRHCGKGAANKRVPEFAWALSARLKRVLLDAFIDGDGHRPAARAGVASAVTTSPYLRDGIQRLAVECGLPCTVGPKRQPQPHHAPSWQISIGRGTRRTITLRTGRHLGWQPYQGEVWCLVVPTGAYVTRRNGKVAITGNSAHWYNKTDAGIVIHRETESSTLIHVQKTRYEAIGRPGKLHATFLAGSRRYEVDTSNEQPQGEL